MTTSRATNLRIGSENIEIVVSFCLLGLTIDSVADSKEDSKESSRNKL